jgi:hypothetical protein
MTDKYRDMSYPVSIQFNMHFSPYEDRLVLRAQRTDKREVHMLLTRRMVMLVLQQMLGKLPELTGLEKTPAVYWQEVLQMAHQGAMEAKATADRAMADERKAAAEARSAGFELEADDKESAPPVPENLFLATELTTQISGEQLTLAFKGLAMPHAMVKPSQPEPLFAMPLQVDNVHQLIELLIAKCQEAQWHLPLELPWLETPDAGNVGSKSKKYSLLHH